MPDELKAAMQALSDKAVKVLEEAMDGDDLRTRILAANAVLDRGYGKPAQTMTAKFEGVDMDGAYLEALKEINRLAKTAPANGTTPVDDGTATTALTMLATQGTAD